MNSNIRIQPNEVLRMKQFLQENQINTKNLSPVKFALKKSAIEMAKNWLLYFSKVFKVEVYT